MLSMWATLTEHDVETYASTLVLPSYLAHLRLGPFRFAVQTANCDGHEPLVLTWLGEGRLEEFRLAPDEHALSLIRFACPGIADARLQLPRDDAQWHWKTGPDSAAAIRIYFAPTTQSLCDGSARPVAADAYVSVSRSHLFVGRATIAAYLTAWLAHLGVQADPPGLDFNTPSAGIEFTAGRLGGQLQLDDRAAVEDLVRFAGLDPILGHVQCFAELNADAPFESDGGILEDGVYFQLVRKIRDDCPEPGEKMRRE